MKIAFFIYYYPSEKRVYIVSLYNMLLSLGHDVHIFSYFVQDPADLSDNKQNNKNRSYVAIQCSFLQSAYRMLRKILHRIKREIFRYLPFMRNLYIEFCYNCKITKDLIKIRNNLRSIDSFDFSIGIEKGGIICAYQLYKLRKTPYYYLSLELYNKKHPFIRNPSMFKSLRHKEVIAHRKAVGTIIADNDRKNALYKAGNIDISKPAFYLPISFDENINTEEKQVLSSNNYFRKIIINFGYNRIPDDFFISLLKKMPSEYVFLMHNFDTKYHEELSRKYSLSNIQFSNEFMNESEIMSIISNSYIGICWYNDSNVNDKLTAFSSEKTSRYLAAGKPIIANAKTNFTKLFSMNKCGIAVNSPEEFIEALNIIKLNYLEYSSQARKAYDNIYKLSNYHQSINSFFKNSL